MEGPKAPRPACHNVPPRHVYHPSEGLGKHNTRLLFHKNKYCHTRLLSWEGCLGTHTCGSCSQSRSHKLAEAPSKAQEVPVCPSSCPCWQAHRLQVPGLFMGVYAPGKARLGKGQAWSGMEAVRRRAWGSILSGAKVARLPSSTVSTLGRRPRCVVYKVPTRLAGEGGRSGNVTRLQQLNGEGCLGKASTCPQGSQASSLYFI